MEQDINFFVALDVHKDEHRGGAAEPGRAPARLVGTIAHEVDSYTRDAVTSVVAQQVQGQTTQGRDLSALAPLRALRARAPDRAWKRRAVDEGVKSCPRAGCGKHARPVR
jgi:hypothetical protein